MAVLNLSVTISDDDLPRLMTAARHAFPKGRDENGNERDLSDVEIIECIRQYGVGMMRQLVRNYEKAVAVRIAEALEPTIEIA